MIDEVVSEQPQWRKSRRSGGENQCVQVAPVAGHLAVRDSKSLHEARLLFTPAEWSAFTRSARTGKFDLR